MILDCLGGPSVTMRVLGREGRRVRVRERWWRTGPRAKDVAAHRPGKGEEVDSPQGNPSFYFL